MFSLGRRSLKSSTRQQNAGGDMDRRHFLFSNTAAAVGLAINATGRAKDARKEIDQPGGANSTLNSKSNPPALTAGYQAAGDITEGSSPEAPKWMKWWANNFLRSDIDWAPTDAPPDALSRFNADDIVSALADAGVQSFWFYIQGPSGWLWYPTKVGHQQPQLQGRDLVGEVWKACRRHGLRFLGYYDPIEMGIEVTLHPEWRAELVGYTRGGGVPGYSIGELIRLNRDALPSSPRLWGNLCFNRPGAWDHYLEILRESLTRYEMDAAWFDCFRALICACPYCQMRYRRETGRELPFYPTPRGINYPGNLDFGRNYPDGSEFGLYFYQIQDWLNKWSMDFRQVVKEIQPDCVVLFQYSSGGDDGYTVAMAEAGDVTTRDSCQLGYQFQHSLAFKDLRGFSHYLPFDVEMSIANHHGDETSPKQEGLLKQQFAYILVHGGAISYVDTMAWQGRIAKKKYKRMKRINDWCRERFSYLGGMLVADVGIYISHESNLYHPKWHHWRWRSPRGDAQVGTEFSIHNTGNVAFTQAMIRENIPFDVIHRHKLNTLSRHKVVYMNNVEILRQEEAESLRQFVESGGGLVVTHRTGMRDERYQERKDFLLEDLIGVSYLETPSVATSFVVVNSRDRMEGFFENVDYEANFFDVQGPQCYVEPRKGTRCLGKIARPRRPYNEDGSYYAGAPPVMQLIDHKEIPQSNIGWLYEPEVSTKHPAVVLHQYGRGRVAYCASYPCYDCIDDIHDLIVSLVNWSAGGKLDATVNSNAPGPVEIVTMERLNRKQTVIHALNWQPNWPGVRALDIEASVKTFGRRAEKAYAIEAKSELELTADHDRVHVTFPPIEAWESIVIDWA